MDRLEIESTFLCVAVSKMPPKDGKQKSLILFAALIMRASFLFP